MSLPLLDLMQAPQSAMICLRVDPDGHVLQGAADILHEWRLNPKRTYPSAEIELHRAASGLWMWSVSYGDNLGGFSYKVGEKWGRFAETPLDALRYAVAELCDRTKGWAYDQACAKQARAWAEGLL